MSIEIRNEVCDICAEKNGWYKEVHLKMDENFPEWRTKLSSLYPNWKYYMELLNAIPRTKCVVFDYDDCTESICENHIKEMFNRPVA